ncbi:MAG: hypothetical protein V1844_05300 [Pseudomonadota bacterium]
MPDFPVKPIVFFDNIRLYLRENPVDCFYQFTGQKFVFDQILFHVPLQRNLILSEIENILFAAAVSDHFRLNGPGG